MDYDSVVLSRKKYRSLSAHFWRAAKYFNCMSCRTFASPSETFLLNWSTYWVIVLSAVCCCRRCAFVPIAPVEHIPNDYPHVDTVIVLADLCSLTVNRCSFPSINKLIKSRLGSITAHFSCESDGCHGAATQLCSLFFDFRHNKEFRLLLSFFSHHQSSVWKERRSPALVSSLKFAHFCST